LNTSPPCLHNRFKDYKVSEIEGLKCSIYVKMQCKGTVKATVIYFVFIALKAVHTYKITVIGHTQLTDLGGNKPSP